MADGRSPARASGARKPKEPPSSERSIYIGGVRGNIGNAERAKTSTSDVTHVGIYIGAGEMLDAPHSGAKARVETFPTTVGALWGDDIYLGATTVL
jgi:hypothetical protein